MLWAIAAALVSGSSWTPAQAQAPAPGGPASAQPAPAQPAPAQPAPATKATQAAAEQAFTRGLLALSGGQLKEAGDAFVMAYRLQPRPATLLNLGIVRTRQGRSGAALQAFEQYMRTADPIRDGANVQAVRGEMARIRATSTTLKLALSPTTADVAVTVDGRLVPRLGADQGEVVMPPGRHRIQVTAPGFMPYGQDIDLPAGRFSFSLTLTPAPAAAPPTVALPTAAAAPVAVPPVAVAPAAPTTAATGPTETPTDTASEAGEPDAGPRVSPHAILGAPHALGVGVAVRLPPYFSLAAEAQWLPTLSVSGADVSSQQFSASVRVHPWRNGFFASAGFALVSIDATVDRSVASGTATVNLPSLSLGLGYASEGSGLFIGVDAALLIELYETELQTPTFEDPAVMEAANRVEGQVRDAIDDVKTILPVLFQLNLFRIGYSF